MQIETALHYRWLRLQAVVLLALGLPDEAQKVARHLRQLEPAVTGQLERHYLAVFTIARALDGTH